MGRLPVGDQRRPVYGDAPGVDAVADAGARRNASRWLPDETEAKTWGGQKGEVLDGGEELEDFVDGQFDELLASKDMAAGDC